MCTTSTLGYDCSRRTTYGDQSCALYSSKLEMTVLKNLRMIRVFRNCPLIGLWPLRTAIWRRGRRSSVFTRVVWPSHTSGVNQVKLNPALCESEISSGWFFFLLPPLYYSQKWLSGEYRPDWVFEGSILGSHRWVSSTWEIDSITAWEWVCTCVDQWWAKFLNLKTSMRSTCEMMIINWYTFFLKKISNLKKAERKTREGRSFPLDGSQIETVQRQYNYLKGKSSCSWSNSTLEKNWFSFLLLAKQSNGNYKAIACICWLMGAVMPLDELKSGGDCVRISDNVVRALTRVHIWGKASVSPVSLVGIAMDWRRRLFMYRWLDILSTITIL